MTDIVSREEAQRMIACAPLLPPPGDEVLVRLAHTVIAYHDRVAEQAAEIERLRSEPIPRPGEASGYEVAILTRLRKHDWAHGDIHYLAKALAEIPRPGEGTDWRAVARDVSYRFLSYAKRNAPRGHVRWSVDLAQREIDAAVARHTKGGE